MNWKILDGSWTQSGSKTAPDTTPLTEADVPPRRIVLRGALAAGCSLLLPASLLGCSKKEAGTAGTEPPASSPETAAPASPAPMESAAPSSPAPMESAAPAAPAKMSQASVKYQTEPKGEQKCANCMHFIAESSTCKLVEGNISPNGWCIIWAKKA
jgi:hypothetical protein